jgi:hypothetical protein
VAYAYSIDKKGKPEPNGAGFTVAVACGLSTKCNDHTLVVINVIAGSTTDSVKISIGMVLLYHHFTKKIK